MTAPSRHDWQKSASDDAIAIARQTCRREDLPARVEHALQAYEAVVEKRKERPLRYDLAVDTLVMTVLEVSGAAPACFKWAEPIQRAIDDLRLFRPAERQACRRALAGKVWRVYRDETAGQP